MLYTQRYQRRSPGSKIRFKCIRCDVCCGTGPNIALTVFDVVRMARFLRMHWKKFLKIYTKIIIADIYPFISLKDDGKGRCIFLAYRENGETICIIYPARPMRCRIYPVIVEGLKGKKGTYVDKACPGLGKGPETIINVNAIESYRRERKEHYQLLTKLLLEDGLEPLEALEKALEKLWAEYDNRPIWSDLDNLDEI